MTIADLQAFVQPGLQGDATIGEWRDILLHQREVLAARRRELDEAGEVLEMKLKDYLDAEADTASTDAPCAHLPVGARR